MSTDDKSRQDTVGPNADSMESAKAEGLRYVSDAQPGIHRKRQGRAFVYSDSGGRRIRGAETLGRIKALAVPPPWKDVWMCSFANGHLQATGRDARGRKQYRYHRRWRQTRDESKFTRIIAFARALPKIRRRIRRDLKQRELNREKVLATVVQLVETSLIRVGNEEYARDNASFGLTTMRTRRVKVSGEKVHFHFRGKSGKDYSVAIQDGWLPRIVGHRQEIPGQELFQYFDQDDQRRNIQSGDVNEYLREISAGDFTPAICRKSYVHPAIFDSYKAGALLQLLKRRCDPDRNPKSSGVRAAEKGVLNLLKYYEARKINGTSLRTHLVASLRAECRARPAKSSAKRKPYSHGIAKDEPHATA